MKKMMMGLVLMLAGCCAYPGEAYIKADKSTYEWAAPKLKEWATTKNDPEWTAAVDAKLVSWQARVQKAEQSKKEGE